MRTSADDLMKTNAYRLNAGLYIKRMHLLRVSKRRPLSYSWFLPTSHVARGMATSMKVTHP